MAADTTALAAIYKEVWAPNRVVEQLYQENPILDQVKRTTKYTVGDKALTPIHTGRSGGYSAVPGTGSNDLNAPDAQELQQAEWDFTNHWFQIEIDVQAIVKSKSNSLAVANAVEVEVQGGVNDTAKQLSRQVVSNGDALIAECATTGSSTTVELGSAAGDKGYQAIVRGFLYPGLVIDIGTAANETSEASDRTIQSVSESSSDPDIVVSGAAVDTAAADFVSIANNRSGTTSYEMNGLKNLTATSGALGGLNPSSVPVWAASGRDSTSTAVTLPLFYSAVRTLRQKGWKANWLVTSLKQQEALWKLVQPQMRFNPGQNPDPANGLDSFTFNGIKIDAAPDVFDEDAFLLDKSKLFVLEAGNASWMSDEAGNGSPVWKQDSTRVVDALHYHIQLATTARQSAFSFTALTA